MRSMIFNAKAQLSLEYLLIIVAVISMLGTFLSVAADFSHKSIIALEKQRIGQFHQKLEYAFDELLLFSSGSSKKLHIENQFPWIISFDSGTNLKIKIIDNGKVLDSLSFKVSKKMPRMKFLCHDCDIQISRSGSAFYIINVFNKKQ